MTLVSDTAYHSFIGEVEALNTTTIRRLTPSCRHQLLAIAPATGRVCKRGRFSAAPSQVSVAALLGPKRWIAPTMAAPQTGEGDTHRRGGQRSIFSRPP